MLNNKNDTTLNTLEQLENSPEREARIDGGDREDGAEFEGVVMTKLRREEGVVSKNGWEIIGDGMTTEAHDVVLIRMACTNKEK